MKETDKHLLTSTKVESRLLGDKNFGIFGKNYSETH